MQKNNFNLIRLFAAFQVMLFHTVNHLNLNIKYFNYFKSYRGVIIFFAISGYLIYLSLERNIKKPKQYLKNRALRIFPALWCSTVVSICLLIISDYLKINTLFSKKIIFYIISQLTFFQFWTPDIFRNYGVGVPNGSLWTITVELQFYIILLLIFKLFKDDKKNIKIMNFLALVSIISNIFIYNFFDSNILFVKLFSVTIIPYFYNFAIGVYFAKYRKKMIKYLEDKFWYWFIIYNIYIYGFNVYPEYKITIYSLISNILLSILTLSFALSCKKINNILPKNLDISYGVYLYHMLFLNYFIYKFGRSMNNEIILIYVFVTIIIAILSWKIIEKPLIDKKI